MKIILRYLFLIIALVLINSLSFAQLNPFNPIPKNINIDLANMKTPEYKARIKQYKDTIKFLGKLEKQTLVKAKKELKKLPVEEKHKIKLKNLESDFLTYKSKIGEIDSLSNLKSQINNPKISEYFQNEDLEKMETKIMEVKQNHDKVRQWLDDHPGMFQFSDTSLSTNQKLKELVKSNEINQLPWEEIGVDPESYLAEFKSYNQCLEDGGRSLQSFQSDSSSTDRINQITQLSDQYFGSYENYMIGKEKLTEIEELMDQAKEYREGIEGLLRGDFEKTDKFVSALEARAMEISAMRESAEELDKLESYEADIRKQIDEMRYKADLQSEYEKHLKGKDKKALVNEAMMKGKDMAGDHFKGHEKLLASAQKGLDRLKAGSFNFSSAKNMEVIKPNSLEGKSLGQRLVLGGSLQINREKEYTGIDFSPSLGYLWNKKYMWGIGGTYRAKVNEDERSLLKGEQVYGGRFFMEYNISWFFLHGEYELISHSKIDPNTDKVIRLNAPGALMGVGINYNFMKNVKGNLMVLYNFLYDPLNSPYDKPFVFRFGFNLDK